MTGYGKGSARIGRGEVSVEIRTVNHRFLDFSIRIPRLLGGFDNEIEKILRRSIKRGHVYLTVSFDKTFETDNLSINREFISKTYSELSDWAKKEGIEGGIDLGPILSLPESFTNDAESIPEEKIKAAVKRALSAAVEGCVEMRKKEAAALKTDIEKQLATIVKTSEKIRVKAPAALKIALNKTRKRIEQILGDGRIDNERWVMEAAVLSDRADFTEELVRLESHLAQFGKVLQNGGEVSKKLTFLLQEIHREATTMGNKATDPVIIRGCLTIKEKVEKIREQVQNLE